MIISVILILVILTSSSFAQAALPLQLSSVNHFCFVTRDFNESANTLGTLFGVPTPIGQKAVRSWAWYRGSITPARQILGHVPLGGANTKFTIELLAPTDNYPSIWRELLERDGPSIQHFGVHLPPGTMDETRKALAAAGYRTLQMSQGDPGCYAYIETTEHLGGILELMDDTNPNCSIPELNEYDVTLGQNE